MEESQSIAGAIQVLVEAAGWLVSKLSTVGAKESLHNNHKDNKHHTKSNNNGCANKNNSGD